MEIDDLHFKAILCVSVGVSLGFSNLSKFLHKYEPRMIYSIIQMCFKI